MALGLPDPPKPGDEPKAPPPPPPPPPPPARPAAQPEPDCAEARPQAPRAEAAPQPAPPAPPPPAPPAEPWMPPSRGGSPPSGPAAAERRPLLRSRRTRIGLWVGVYVASAIFVWAWVGWISTRFMLRPWDVTHQRSFTIADETRGLLGRLNQPLRITAIFPERAGLAAGVLTSIETLVENLRVESRWIEYGRIDSDRDRAATREIFARLRLDDRKALNSVVFEYGQRARLVAFDEIVAFEEIKEKGRIVVREKAFYGEPAFANAILNLVEDYQPKVDFTAGHGELDPNDPSGRGLLYLDQALRQEKIDVRQRFLLEKGDIPDDTTVVVVAGPIEPFDPQEVSKLEKFLERGGGLLAIVGPGVFSGLDRIFARYGLELGQHPVVDLEEKQLRTSPTTFYVSRLPNHPIVNGLGTARVRIALTRAIFKLPDSPTYPPTLSRTEILLSSPSSWSETNVADLKRPVFEAEAGDRKGPLAIGVAVEVPPDPTNPQAARTGGIRMVVLGSRQSFSNEGVEQAFGNEDLFQAAVNWLANRSRVTSVRARTPDFRPLQLTEAVARRMTLAAYLVPPGFFVLLGLLIWWRRRT